MDGVFVHDALSKEICNREDYEKDVPSPVQAFLKKYDPSDDRFHNFVPQFLLRRENCDGLCL